MNDCSTGERKKELRARLRRLRNALPEAARASKSAAIARIIGRLAAYRRASTVMFYLTHGSEVRTEAMIETALREGKKVVLPRVNERDNTIEAFAIDSLDRGIVKGAYGIREPRRSSGRSIEPDAIDLVFAPALGFDRHGGRIGHGKGCYDRWLCRIPVEKRVGLSFKAQIVNTLPQDEHDVPVGTVVTETRIINAMKATERRGAAKASGSRKRSRSCPVRKDNERSE